MSVENCLYFEVLIVYGFVKSLPTPTPPHQHDQQGLKICYLLGLAVIIAFSWECRDLTSHSVAGLPVHPHEIHW